MAYIRSLHTTWHKEPQGSEWPQNIKTKEICKFFRLDFILLTECSIQDPYYAIWE
jgi:hypothetical protein